MPGDENYEIYSGRLYKNEINVTLEINMKVKQKILI